MFLKLLLLQHAWDTNTLSNEHLLSFWHLNVIVLVDRDLLHVRIGAVLFIFVTRYL
jgi:hypothetical protein